MKLLFKLEILMIISLIITALAYFDQRLSAVGLILFAALFVIYFIVVIWKLANE